MQKISNGFISPQMSHNFHRFCFGGWRQTTFGTKIQGEKREDFGKIKTTKYMTKNGKISEIHTKKRYKQYLGQNTMEQNKQISVRYITKKCILVKKKYTGDKT
jgi:hypothetical protein